MTLVCGLLGTILGLGVYQYFLEWIGLLASLVPPLIGPVIIDYYLINKRRYQAEYLSRLPKWNPVAALAYLIGACMGYAASQGLVIPGLSWMFPSLLGLLASMLTYFVLFHMAKLSGRTYGVMAFNREIEGEKQ
jgi:cytosine permease